MFCGLDAQRREIPVNTGVCEYIFQHPAACRSAFRRLLQQSGALFLRGRDLETTTALAKATDPETKAHLEASRDDKDPRS
jgi:hypothetical protein